MRFLQKAYALLTVAAVLNFAVFLAFAIHLGGDAVNGKVEGGRYYLYGVRAESGRKVYTEVSKSVFTYSQWHVYSILVTWPLMLLAALLRIDARSGSQRAKGVLSDDA